MAKHSRFFAVLALGAGSCGAGDAGVTLAPKGQQPRVAAHADGTVAVAYADGDSIFCRVSSDGGRSYRDAVAVAKVDRLMKGMRRGPQVAVTGGSIVVSAIGGAGDLLAWRSADRGRAWIGPVVVSDRGGAAREGLHGMAAGTGEDVHAVWLDLRESGTILAGARSGDGGATWTANTVIYRSPGGSICECCQPSVAADERGGVAVMWRNSLDGARDMYLATSNDGGRTFGAAAKLGAGTWPLQACPMDGGGLAKVDARSLTVWRREGRVYAVTPGAEESLVGDGRNPVVAFGPGGAYTAWQTGNEVRLRTPFDATGAAVGNGGFPTLGAAGENGPVVLVWEGSGGRILALPIGRR